MVSDRPVDASYAAHVGNQRFSVFAAKTWANVGIQLGLAVLLLGVWTCGSVPVEGRTASDGLEPVQVEGLMVAPSVDAGDDPAISAALIRLARVVPRFRILSLPTVGVVTVPLSATLTVDDLRGVPLEDCPPVLGQVPTYTGNDSDGLRPEERAFPARGIAPFRFHHFTNEFNITGRGVGELSDYASLHGFSVIAYRPTGGSQHRPSGTGAMRWLPSGGGVPAVVKDIVKTGRYDQICDIADAQDLGALYASDPSSQASFRRSSDTDLLMIDVEDPVLSPEQLRRQAWYPLDADHTTRAAFEAKYYRGFQLLHTTPLTVARAAGYPMVSVYGWQPVPRTWFHLETLMPADPATDWAWKAFGESIYQRTDLLHNDVYCFYYDARNIAYVLANIDLNRTFCAALPPGQRKPIRPYLWLRLHGGGGVSYNWWECQQLFNEEVRAMSAMVFFTGIDGFDSWDWIAQPRYAGVPDPAEDTELMVGRAFTCAAEGGRGDHLFQRYDVVHVVGYDPATGATRFQGIERNSTGYGIVAPGQTAERQDGPRSTMLRTPVWISDGDPKRPYYTMQRSELRQYLRPWLENVGAMVEGLALVHPIEYLLRQGRVEVDVPAQSQYARSLPIVRRVSLGRYHVIITYDPNVVYGRLSQKSIPAGAGLELTDFAGYPGLTLRLPADEQPRILILRVP